jgi:protein tyrosine phosphatase (PTP) superfamily phosphohydrolase (DUF442 family)
MNVTASQKAVSQLESTLENFCVVNDWLYRGGDPTAEVTTVVSLRNRKSLRKKERELCQRFGLQLIEIPTTYWSVNDESLQKAVNSLRDAPRKVYVHCDHGKDRTGIVVAACRMALEGWSFVDAFNEMRAHGFRYIRFFAMTLALKHYAKTVQHK